jgi:hypothetical protein
LPAKVREHVRIKERDRGYDETTMVESFVVLSAVGRKCFDDFHESHEAEKIEAAKERRNGDEIAHTPEETASLAGLGSVNRALVMAPRTQAFALPSTPFGLGPLRTGARRS